MGQNRVELGAETITETTHRRLESPAQIATKPASPVRRESLGGYDSSRFNAMRHGVLSEHTVVRWEDQAEYKSLLDALIDEHAPRGPTEAHLVEEIAGVIWRKRRLLLAEAASYQRGAQRAAEPFSEILGKAFNEVVAKALTVTPLATFNEFVELEKREASARSALEILSAGKAGAYEAALAELDEPTRTSWQEQFAAELEDPDEDEDMDGEVEPYRADATGLAKYLECSVLPDCAQQREQVATRFVIQPEVLSEAFDCEKLERLGRYEAHLDRKLERMLTMLLRLQGLRRSNEPY
jgi:hypothetical protein